MPSQNFFAAHRRLLLILVTLLLAVTLLAWGILYKFQQDRASRNLALTAVESMLREWRAAPLLQVMHAGLREQRSDREWQSYVEALAVLGPLQVMESITGSAQVPLLPFLNAELTAQYRIDMQFEYAPAWVSVSLGQEADQWWITEFVLRSAITDN